MIRRQLRGAGNRRPERFGTVRTRGMEAVGEVPHRAKANLRKAGPTWVSLPSVAKPCIQSRRPGIGGDGGMKSFTPYPVRSLAVRKGGRTSGDTGPRPWEKSDHPIVVWKPGNAGGAKGVMG